MMRTWSDRQFRAALEWASEEINRPSRSDHYAMQIAWVMAVAHGSKESSLDAFKLRFGKPVDEDQPITEEEFQRIVKSQVSMVVGQLGGKVEHRRVPREEAQG